ncbi:class I SAM-dependent methyltransferase [Micromonospora sp. 4G57]|uniref:Class I SAM-dependent methyltransferase n=1 Tax=Micromonospora sicca TaxID=2202420 RepID=A0ABU5JHE9_9ACTN|nr:MULTISPECIES: class I SAM-dependent methyltransferase [unclassified Micromonospora]MDZ5446120.1 class I SAM-dependent methyltransferase [Micromonospora sp. 4G57]MDZ5491996.1 class I SAM-dependent methyltransferase [Micromonospora sp. 4G53]
MTHPDTGLRADPGSFRDPTNRVFHRDGEVLRGLDDRATADWRALAGSGFFRSLLAEGKVCGTEEVAATPPWSATLRHERIPFVSHPYEWSFGMLRDAALLHLEVLRAALDGGFTTKDGSAYNLQWRGAAPVFIDVGSFEPLREGEPWAGYRQFCQTLLYPLLLQAHLGVDFQPWLRARVDGIEPDQMRRFFGGARRLLPGVLTHVHLHGAMQRRNSRATTTDVRAQLRDAGYSRELAAATVRGIEKLVRRLDRPPGGSHWSDYQRTCGYSAQDRLAKERFVEEALAGADTPALALDLGANDGRYARIAARHAGYVVAVEQEPAVVDALYRALRAEGQRRILPLVMDLADPSPGGGWRGVERAGFADRTRADVVLALAVVHHLAIGRNVPLAAVVDQLANLGAPGAALVVEFVHPEDPMARRLLANKPDGLFPDYRRDAFERLLAARCRIIRCAELPSATRTLYQAVVGG